MLFFENSSFPVLAATDLQGGTDINATRVSQADDYTAGKFRPSTGTARNRTVRIFRIPIARNTYISPG